LELKGSARIIKARVAIHAIEAFLTTTVS
jgi:hypothetical protein